MWKTGQLCGKRPGCGEMRQLWGKLASWRKKAQVEGKTSRLLGKRVNYGVNFGENASPVGTTSYLWGKQTSYGENGPVVGKMCKLKGKPASFGEN